MASAQLVSSDHTVMINAFLASLMGKYQVSVVGYAVINAYHMTAVNTLSLDSSITPSADSFFQAASLSKPIAAFTVMNLVSKQELQLEVPVNQQLRSWQIPCDVAGYSERVTPRTCLSMTSGLTYGEPGTVFAGYPNDTQVPLLEQFLNGLAPATNPAIRASYNPGQTYAYTGAGYMVMQKLIEDVISKPFQAMMEQDFFPTLSMRCSNYASPLSEALRHHAVPGFNKHRQMLMGGWDNNPAPASGGLWSTPTDIAHFMVALSESYLGQDDTFVSKENAREMLSRQPNSLFGLGLVVNDCGKSFNFRKIGFNRGYANALIMFPEVGQGLVVMTNSANGMALIKAFVAYVALIQYWPYYTANFDET